ncbi:hypothetical protein ACFE04_020810 [Oxalis oulophora]
MDSKPVKYTWRFENFSKLMSMNIDKREHCSDYFMAGGYKWNILFYLNVEESDLLHFYLELSDHHETFPDGGTMYADFYFSVVNQIDEEQTLLCGRGRLSCQFRAHNYIFGCRSLMHLSELIDPDVGYIVNDTLVVEANLTVGKRLLTGFDNQAPLTVRLGDFKEIMSNNYVVVSAFTIPKTVESYANMDSTSIGNITESLILKWRDTISIRGASQHGFKVDCLKNHLKDVAQAYLARLARNYQESRELQGIDDKIVLIQKELTDLEKQLETLKAERVRMYNKTYSELRKSCEAAEAKFAGKSCYSLFNN